MDFIGCFFFFLFCHDNVWKSEKDYTVQASVCVLAVKHLCMCVCVGSQASTVLDVASSVASTTLVCAPG